MTFNIKEAMEGTPTEFEWLPRRNWSRREAFERREATIKAIEQLRRVIEPHLLSMNTETRQAYNTMALTAERVVALELKTIEQGD